MFENFGATNLKKYMIAIISCILPAILLATVLASTAIQTDTHSRALVNFHSVSVRYISGTNSLFQGVLAKVNGLGPSQASGLDPSRMTDNDIASITNSPNSLLMLDGDWLNGHASDAQTKPLLRTALSGAKIIVVGGTTSTFFDLLNADGVNHLATNPDGTVRNPDSFNAAQVGFCLKTTTAPDGTSHSYPSILTSSLDTPDNLANVIADWISR